MRKRQIQVRVIQEIILVKLNYMTEADLSMLNTSISVGKINLKETNTSACYTGIILVKMNSVDIV